MNNVPLGFMRMDLHCHTDASRHCTHPLEALLERLLERQISVVAVTDENTLDGAWQLAQLARSSGAPLQVIVGQEIHSGEGCVHGLFLTRPIASGLGAEATVREIRAQGGLVMLSHLFDSTRRERMDERRLERIAAEADLVETWCGTVRTDTSGAWSLSRARPHLNRVAAQWADRRGLAHSAGSDAHTLREIGEAYVETPERTLFRPHDLLEALRDGTVQGQTVHPALALMQRVVGFGSVA